MKFSLLLLSLVCFNLFGQREHKFSAGIIYGFEFPLLNERIEGDEANPVRLLPSYKKISSKGFFIASDNRFFLKPEFTFMHMEYADWKSETGSYFFTNSTTKIDYFGLNFRKMQRIKTRNPSYFYLEAGFHYGLVSFSQPTKHSLSESTRYIPKEFKMNSWGIQYGGTLNYGISRRMDMITKISFHNSYFSYLYLEETSHFTFGLHFGISYKFMRELNPFNIR